MACCVQELENEALMKDLARRTGYKCSIDCEARVARNMQSRRQLSRPQQANTAQPCGVQLHGQQQQQQQGHAPWLHNLAESGSGQHAPGEVLQWQQHLLQEDLAGRLSEPAALVGACSKQAQGGNGMVLSDPNFTAAGNEGSVLERVRVLWPCS